MAWASGISCDSDNKLLFIYDVQVYEVGMLKDRYIATVYTAIPATTVTSAESVELDVLDFACEQRRSYTHEAVGAGKYLSQQLYYQNTIEEEGLC